MFEGQSDKINEIIDEMGDDHISGSAKNPLREDAFAISEKEKIELIRKDFAHILHTLGMDLTDDSLKGTPLRVARSMRMGGLAWPVLMNIPEEHMGPKVAVVTTSTFSATWEAE